jgi:ADP-ribose pyrophosphatase YjhB (NUDIX family)
MPDEKHPLTQEEFNHIYSKVPRLTVEIVVKNGLGEIYLTKRAIEPCKGQWHLPGGTVRFGERLEDAVKRIAKRELGIEFSEIKDTGYIEYPSHYLNGMDSPVGIVFEVLNFQGEMKVNEEASNADWFSAVPIGTHADLDTYLNVHYFKPKG